MHEDRPEASAYVPALQRWQDTLPAVEAALPKAHAVQLVAPAPLNVPGAHSVEAEEEGPLKDPAGACVQLEEPTSAEKVPARQGTQAEREVAPREEEAVPAGQLTQPDDVCPAAAP